MNVKSIASALAIISFISCPAFAAPSQSRQNIINQRAEQARKICQEKRLTPKAKNLRLCEQFGICTNNYACSQVVQQWQDQSLDNIRESPPQKLGYAPQPSNSDSQLP